MADDKIIKHDPGKHTKLCVSDVRNNAVFVVFKVFLRIWKQSEPKHTGCVLSHLACNSYKRTYRKMHLHAELTQIITPNFLLFVLFLFQLYCPMSTLL